VSEDHLIRRKSWFPIATILWRDWNPIGFPVPEDEYDAYVPKIIRMLEAGAGVDELTAFLSDFRENVVGASDRAADRRVAQMLYDLPSY
jgi:hypothetical protein